MNEVNFKHYLLGMLSEAERSAIDHQVLTDDQVFEELLLAEEDLIEAYLQHELSAAEQKHFEQCFLADPERQQRLRLAQALYRAAATKSKVVAAPAAAERSPAFWQRPLWQWALAGCFVVALLFGLKAIFTPRPQEMLVHSSPPPTLTPTLSAGTEIRSLELLPGQTRSRKATGSIIALMPKVGTVQFKLWLENAPYSHYEAVITPDGEPERKIAGQWQPQSAPEGKYLLVQVPSTLLGTGGNRLKLFGVTGSGLEPAEGYSFHVKRNET
ncbi:MAG TPA: hypothetical protein VFZ34_09380 [Blastocatellia bacterium]|nr:hypothetical protein [Blastocatellia bacterium]